MSGIDLASLSPKHRAYVKKQLTEAAKRPQTRVSAAVSDFSYDSALEARFAQYLAAMTWSDARLDDGCSVLEWRYHPMTFHLAPGLKYTPDFGANVIADGDQWCPEEPRYRLYEIKGSWLSKNARDSRTRLKVAAALFPFFEWEAVTPGSDGSFQFEPIGGRE